MEPMQTETRVMNEFEQLIFVFEGNFDLFFRISSPSFPETVWSLYFVY